VKRVKLMTVKIRSKGELITYLAEGGSAKYIFFWGHTKPKNGSIDKSCFSQWYDAGFEIDNIHYPTAEHYMMAEKARLFGDDEMLEQILTSVHPRKAKQLGREVKHYDETRWQEQRFEIVTTGNMAKFSQNEKLKTFLLNSGNRVLVEASPRDRIWGIGMGTSNPDVENPAKWRGLNLLGFALMEARYRIFFNAR
jgi:ribA/ribD-fused uncharacterized protein